MVAHDFSLDELFADDPELLQILKNDSALPSASRTPPAPLAFLDPEELFGSLPTEPSSPAVNASVPGDEQTGADHKPSPELRIAKKAGRLLFNVLFYALCIAIIMGAALYTLSGSTQKSFFGYRFYHVLTPSMVPRENSPPGGFYAGDMIVIKLCGAEDIQVGDIITFVPNKNAKSFLTHRVVEINDQLNGKTGIYFITRGDANDADDPPIRADGPSPMLIGKKVLSVRGLGSVLQFIRQHFILVLTFLLSALGFIFVLRYYTKH